MLSLADREAILAVRNPCAPLAARIRHTIEKDLLDLTHIVVIEANDSEPSIIEEIGFSPLVHPIDGHRFGHEGFEPYWDWLTDHGGCFELCLSVANSGFAFVLFIEDAETELAALCRSAVHS